MSPDHSVAREKHIVWKPQRRLKNRKLHPFVNEIHTVSRILQCAALDCVVLILVAGSSRFIFHLTAFACLHFLFSPPKRVKMN